MEGYVEYMINFCMAVAVTILPFVLGIVLWMLIICLKDLKEMKK